MSNQTTIEKLRNLAKDAIQEHRAEYPRLGTHFPMPKWAHDVLEILDEAEAGATVSSEAQQSVPVSDEPAEIARLNVIAEAQQRMVQIWNDRLESSQPAAPQQEPVAYLLEPIGRLSKLVARQLHFDRPISGPDWIVTPLGPIASHPHAAQPTDAIQVPDWLLTTAQNLAKTMARDMGATTFEVLDDLPGIVSQIDNMFCWYREQAKAAQPREAGQARNFLRERAQLEQEWCELQALKRAAQAAQAAPSVPEGLVKAAQSVLAHRDGDLPTRGWLRDNDSSRKALAALAAAIAAQSKGASE